MTVIDMPPGYQHPHVVAAVEDEVTTGDLIVVRWHGEMIGEVYQDRHGYWFASAIIDGEMVECQGAYVTQLLAIDWARAKGCDGCDVTHCDECQEPFPSAVRVGTDAGLTLCPPCDDAVGVKYNYSDGQ